VDIPSRSRILHQSVPIAHHLINSRPVAVVGAAPPWSGANLIAIAIALVMRIVPDSSSSFVEARRERVVAVDQGVAFSRRKASEFFKQTALIA
jgi:hypothetical protein